MAVLVCHRMKARGQAPYRPGVLRLISQICKAFHGLGNGRLQWHFGLIVHIVLRTLTAVVVVSAGQSNRHWSERRTQRDERFQKCRQPRQQHGNEVDEQVRQVILGGSVAETDQHLRQERPEVYRLVVRNVVRLHTRALST